MYINYEMTLNLITYLQQNKAITWFLTLEVHVEGKIRRDYKNTLYSFLNIIFACIQRIIFPNKAASTSKKNFVPPSLKSYYARVLVLGAKEK